MSRLEHYQTTYEECRRHFTSKAKSIGGTELRQLAIPSPTESGLFTDILFLPPTKEPRDLLILNSGIHGVEGFVGSAIQQMFLTEILPTLDRAHLGVLIIHLLNPYGTKHQLRVSENNVDLNRNFGLNDSMFHIKNAGYSKLSSVLNPTEKASLNALSRTRFYSRMAAKLFQASRKALRQAILGGQFEHPKGIFFGGNKFEPQRDLLEPILRQTWKPFHRALILDLHTGYGRQGALHLIPNPPHPAVINAAIEKAFAGHFIEDPQSEEFFRNAGDFSTYVSDRMKLDQKLGVPMVLEFGTYDNTKIAGAMESLRRVVCENQMRLHGAVSETDRERIQRQFVDWFFPASSHWRENVLALGSLWIPRFISNFQNT